MCRASTKEYRKSQQEDSVRYTLSVASCLQSESPQLSAPVNPGQLLTSVRFPSLFSPAKKPELEISMQSCTGLTRDLRICTNPLI
ncbi:hypothetical protein Y1Q_0009235 [Alligator mississippiensis]|uniref:Uncharacterized protein n=1 Tax=Alligator mississippiensis TaxID=8496 RepID=A0A151M2T2_ALLMI|nr:hypothetical protein Y1Q_0009235 [Alligator mississippiensis]